MLNAKSAQNKQCFAATDVAEKEAAEEIVPKAPGFERRRPLYDLYHILNHANLFGGGYHDDAAALMKKCLKNLDS